MLEHDKLSLDLNTFQKLAVTLEGGCGESEKCPILELYKILSDTDSFVYARAARHYIRLFDGLNYLGYEDNIIPAKFVIDCYKKSADLPCGSIYVEQSLHERNPELLFRAQFIKTSDGQIKENPYRI